jgi:hypothetical protein
MLLNHHLVMDHTGLEVAGQEVDAQLQGLQEV